jgi:sulfate transport system permease protein
VRRVLIGATIVILVVLLVWPLAAVVGEALKEGARVAIASVTDDAALSAIRLTLIVAAIVVPLNTLFGLAAAWMITRFSFRGRDLLLTAIDLPLSVSPVIGGMIFVLLFGARGLFGPWLAAHGVSIVFALPGMVLATMFVTLPIVARELVATMQGQGRDDEEAALTLGANGWQLFRRVTLPNIKRGLLYGVILCNARAMGEFGAVAVVSGHIIGRTETLPLYVDTLHDNHRVAASFAIASLLVALALVTLVLQQLVGKED